MEINTISTGDAARLCSVKPDTILKWIRSGKIEATRTAGGHFRIDPNGLKPFLSNSAASGAADITGRIPTGDTISCWQFYSKDGEMPSQCQDCIVWKARIERCYVIAKSGLDSLHAGLYCSDECRSCEYYRLVNKSRYRLLIISEDKSLTKRFCDQQVIQFDIKCACCGYYAARRISQFQPDIILIDETLRSSDLHELLSHLKADPQNKKSLIVIGTYSRQKADDTGSNSVFLGDVENLFSNLQGVLDKAGDKKEPDEILAISG